MPSTLKAAPQIRSAEVRLRSHADNHAHASENVAHRQVLSQRSTNVCAMATNYSFRSSAIGSILNTFFAGTTQAAIATADNITAIAANVIGSVGLTWYNMPLARASTRLPPRYP